jgi:hypothetical protein
VIFTVSGVPMLALLVPLTEGGFAFDGGVADAVVVFLDGASLLVLVGSIM